MSEIESVDKITSKGQTTLPIAVRKALQVGPQDKISFKISNNVVIVEKLQEDSIDPVVRKYLEFLEQDMLANPQQLSVLQRDNQLQTLLTGVETEDFGPRD